MEAVWVLEGWHQTQHSSVALGTLTCDSQAKHVEAKTITRAPYEAHITSPAVHAPMSRLCMHQCHGCACTNVTACMHQCHGCACTNVTASLPCTQSPSWHRPPWRTMRP